ncbi:MAG: 5-oxoprolinase subunit B/C family protein [Acidimicrobiales bacterium]
MGDAALLFDFDRPDRVAAWASSIAAAGWPGVVEVVAGLRSVLVEVDPAVTDLDRLAGQVAELDADHRDTAVVRRTHLVPATFGGPDLQTVCRLTGLSPEDLVALMTGVTFRVAMVGFAPGFGYLSGLPEPLASVPRRDTPRPVVPAGSVGLAGGFAAVYPQATPGGWHLVGRTPWRPFDAEVPPYGHLGVGDAVRFLPAPEQTDRSVAGSGPASGPSRRPWAAGPAARFVVEDPGMHTTAQDGGRYGVAHLGVPRAGPADPLAHSLANLLVGNRRHAAALEVTARGPVLRCLTTTHVAVVGGGAVVTVDDREVAQGRVVPVTAGQRVAVRHLGSGLRTYVAWPGGVEVPPVMGSRSTDMLAGVGPGALVAGDVLGAVDRAGPLGDRLAAGTPGQDGPTSRAVRRVRVVAGPHPSWFPPDTLARLATTRYAVEAEIDRVGVRLRPVDGAGIERRPGELGSQGMVTGAVQVPPDGRPVILGPDHGTLGGYPVVAVVVSADRWMLGQCRPGDEVELEPVSGAEAAAARRSLERTVERAVVGRYPTVVG